MKNFIKYLWIFITLFLCVDLTAQAASLDSIAAVVNDTVITQSQLDREMQNARQAIMTAHAPMPTDRELRQKVLQQLIDTQLQLQVAKKMGINIDDKSLNAAIAQIAQRNNITLDQLKAELQRQGMSYSAYQKSIREQMIISQVQERAINPQINISEQDIKDVLNSPNVLHAVQTQTATPAKTSNNTSYQVQDFLISLPENPTAQQLSAAQQTAQTVLKALRANNVDAANMNAQSNDLGWRTLNQLPEVFAKAVQNLKTGEVAGPIRTGNGLHVIMLAGVQGSNNDTTATASQPASVETHVRHILIKVTPLEPDSAVKLRLERIRNDITSGGDFAKQAEANSQDPGSASKGGDLGWVMPGMLDPNFEQAMNKLKIGEISEPIKTQFGWHLIQVLGRKPIQGQQNLRNQAEKIVYQQKFEQALQKWLQQLRSQSYIRIYND